MKSEIAPTIKRLIGPRTMTDCSSCIHLLPSCPVTWAKS
jgi:hypothetical protein